MVLQQYHVLTRKMLVSRNEVRVFSLLELEVWANLVTLKAVLTSFFLTLCLTFYVSFRRDYLAVFGGYDGLPIYRLTLGRQGREPY